MKRVTWYFLCVVSVLIWSCGGTPAVVQPPPAAQMTAEDPSPAQNAAPASLSLDGGLEKAAERLTRNIETGTRLAIVSIDAETGELSRYISSKLGELFRRSGSYELSERSNINILIDELNFQAGGYVNDSVAKSIGNMDEVDVVIYGGLEPQRDGRHMLTLNAADVERGTVKDVFVEPVTLPEVYYPAAADERYIDFLVERAVFQLSRRLEAKATVAVGRIGLEGSGSISDLSEFLKYRIESGAEQLDTKFEVHALKGDDTGLEVKGRFRPHGPENNADADVTLQLVSADGTLRGSAMFVIPASALKRHNLHIYPPKGSAGITRAEQERKDRIIKQYDGSENKFGLTALPEHEDGIYYEDQLLRFSILAEQDCYVKISYVDVLGECQVLFPTTSRDLNYQKVTAGKSWTLPNYIRLTLGGPPGEENILIDAFEYPLEAQAPEQTPLEESPAAREMRARKITLARAIERENDDGTIELVDNQAPASAANFSYSIFPRRR